METIKKSNEMKTKTINKANDMETKTINKTEKMETTIYHNYEKTATDIANIFRAKNLTDLAVLVLQEQKINPKHAASVLQGSYSETKNEYIALENQKLEAAEKLLGASALIDVARQKITGDAETIISNLAVKIKPLEWQMHYTFNHIEFVDDAWRVKMGFEAEIERLNSIILTEPTDKDLFDKHVKLVELINELKGDNGTLMGIINNLLKFDATTKEFSIKFRLFDKNNVIPAYL